MSAMTIGPADRMTVRSGVRTGVRADASRGAASRSSLTGAELRLTRRGRVVLAALALVVVAIAAFVGAQSSAASGSEPVVDRHVVRAGETLWGIAEQSRGAGESVAEQVRELVRVNGLSGAQVMAGQELEVPRG